LPQVRHIEVFARSAAPPDEVWRWLADASSWNVWTWLARSELEREGVPAPDGVGAIRRFSIGPGLSREEVVGFDPPWHLAYILLSGLPVQDYRADVQLSPDGTGTLIAWRARFTPKLPGSGAALAVFLRANLTGFARGLARHTTPPASS
jgi:hypothetical protein